MKVFIEIAKHKNENIYSEYWMKKFDEELDVRLAVMYEGGWKR